MIVTGMNKLQKRQLRNRKNQTQNITDLQMLTCELQARGQEITDLQELVCELQKQISTLKGVAKA